LHKVTIIPRGRALGVTMFLPERDKYSQSKQEIKAMMASLFGGRVAEELIFGKDKVTSGASSDIQAATGLARNMVTRWGYSDKLGLVSYGDNQEEVFLGHSVSRTQNVSEETANIIDSEVKRLVQAGYDEAKRILTEKLEDLHTLAKALLEYETLSGDEIVAALKGIAPNREDVDLKRPTGPAVAVPISPKPEPA
jgi:cell division protease FtsH